MTPLAALAVIDPATLDPTTIMLLIGAGMATVILQALGNRRTGKVLESTKPLGNGFAQEWQDLQAQVAALTALTSRVEGLLTAHMRDHDPNHDAYPPEQPGERAGRLDEPPAPLRRVE